MGSRRLLGRRALSQAARRSSSGLIPHPREQSLFRDHPKDVTLRPVMLQHSTARHFTGRRIYSRPSDPSFRSTTPHPDLVLARWYLSSALGISLRDATDTAFRSYLRAG